MYSQGILGIAFDVRIGRAHVHNGYHGGDANFPMDWVHPNGERIGHVGHV